MIARATMAEIDPVRMSVDDAVELFRESVLPALHEQPGYEGVYVLVAPEGQALVLTFWESEEAAAADSRAGASTSEQFGKFVTIFRVAARPRDVRGRARGRAGHRHLGAST